MKLILNLNVAWLLAPGQPPETLHLFLVRNVTQLKDAAPGPMEGQEVDGKMPKENARAQSPPVPRPSVLVVDDEVILGRSVKRMLDRECNVTVTTGARDALEIFARGVRFDVILCDLMMPEMTGMDLQEELCRRLPEQASRMVFVTGGAFTDRARLFLERSPNPRLEKPFDNQALRTLVRTLCSAAARA